MKKRRQPLILLVAAIAACFAVWAVFGRPMPNVDDAARVFRLPKIHPDYSELVIPPNIAPMNFVIREPGSRFLVRIGSDNGDTIEINARSSKIF